MDLFAKKFDLDILFVKKYFDAAINAFNNESGKILDLQSLEIFSSYKDKLISIRNSSIKDPDNVIYCYLLRQALIERDLDAVKALGTPNSHLNEELYDTLPLFSLLSLIPDMILNHKKLGIPEVITKATLGMFENQIQESIYVLHKFGISAYTSWMAKFIYSEIIRIGRLNFEICRFDKPYEVYLYNDDVYILPNGVNFHQNGQILGSVGCENEKNSFFADICKKDGKIIGYLLSNGVCKNEKVILNNPVKVLSHNDLIVNVHIPFDGPLTEEACDEAFTEAKKIISISYGDFPAFMCVSWLLDPQLEQIAGQKTNITRFGDRFARFPAKSAGNEVFEYLFMQPSDTPPNKLNAVSGFAKSIKSHLVDGGHIYGAGGLLLTKGIL